MSGTACLAVPPILPGLSPTTNEQCQTDWPHTYRVTECAAQIRSLFCHRLHAWSHAESTVLNRAKHPAGMRGVSPLGQRDEGIGGILDAIECLQHFLLFRNHLHYA